MRGRFHKKNRRHGLGGRGARGLRRALVNWAAATARRDGSGADSGADAEWTGGERCCRPCGQGLREFSAPVAQTAATGAFFRCPSLGAGRLVATGALGGTVPAAVSVTYLGNWAGESGQLLPMLPQAGAEAHLAANLGA
jgi:hypothetical protein